MTAQPLSFQIPGGEDVPVPLLRRDISIKQTEADENGDPAWLIYDPVGDAYFRVGWLDFEIMGQFDGRGTVQDIASRVASRVGLPISDEAVQSIVDFIRQNNLALVDDTQKSRFRARNQKSQSFFNSVLHNYLFFRIPLFKPDRFLTWFLPSIRWLGSPVFRVLLVILAFVAFGLTIPRLGEYGSTILDFFSIEGLVLYGVAIFFIKVLHEFGHAFIAKAHGCRVSTMGIAFILLWPVLYTDTTDAWRTTNRRGRLWIDCGGILVELAIGIVCLLLWHLVPDGPLRSVFFVLSSVTLVLTLLINLNPFMKFDGYYIFADSLGIANLQERSFAQARWWMRECLFGFGDPPPERPRPVWIIYAFATWVYRLFLFIGIAIIVYQFFIKIVGIILFIVEIFYFIIRPIGKELITWARRYGEVNMKAMIRLLFLLAIPSILVAIPWRSELSLPAIIEAQYAILHVSEPGFVSSASIARGQVVQAGETLIELESPQLEHEIDRLTRNVEILRWQRQNRGLTSDLLERARVTTADLEAQTAAVLRLSERRSLLTHRAPFGGTVRAVVPDLRSGVWLGRGETLAAIVAPTVTSVKAFVSEIDVSRLHNVAEAVFIADGDLLGDATARITSIAQTSETVWNEPYLASEFEGPIAVVPAEGDQNWRTVIPHYDVRAELDTPIPTPNRPVPGRLVVQVEPRSLLERVVDATVGVLRRELSF